MSIEMILDAFIQGCIALVICLILSLIAMCFFGFSLTWAVATAFGCGIGTFVGNLLFS